MRGLPQTDFAGRLIGNGGRIQQGDEKMTYAVITVAGVSSRFNQREETPVLKCIYHTEDHKKTLLYSILKKCRGCKGVIIVGGYQFGELEKYIENLRGEFPFGIDVICNPYYETYGSGYSLKTGLQECYSKPDCTDVVFIEGDLFFDSESMAYITDSKKSCLTVNSDPIMSKKAVALYINEQNEIKYLYDTQHGLFRLPEPFSEIYNSGQVWKFSEKNAAVQVMAEMDESDWHGTNLCFVERYLNHVSREHVEIVKFKKWVNCNTREDYRNCEKYL